MAFKMNGTAFHQKQGKKPVPEKKGEAAADPDFWKTAEDGSMVNKHYYVNKDSSTKEKTNAGWIKSEDGTLVPPNYYKE